METTTSADPYVSHRCGWKSWNLYSAEVANDSGSCPRCGSELRPEDFSERFAEDFENPGTDKVVPF